jgi:Flp pilus assembly protein TadG
MTPKRRRQSGTASVEFAIVGALYSLCIVLILCLGVTLCAKAVLGMAAWDTARCAAIGSADCPLPDDFARARVRKWGGAMFGGSIQVSATPATACGAAVTLTLTGDRLIGGPLAGKACFPAIHRGE